MPTRTTTSATSSHRLVTWLVQWRSTQAALAIKPEFADAQANWGNVLFTQGRFDDAASHYAIAASLDPSRAGVHFNWGLALMKQGDLQGAIAHYQQALELDPDLADARSALAEALDRMHKPR